MKKTVKKKKYGNKENTYGIRENIFIKRKRESSNRYVVVGSIIRKRS